MRPALPLLALVLGGCFDRQYDCDTLARASVEVTLESASGVVLEDAEVRYSVGAASSVACDRQGATWLCGWDVAGEMVIEATAACHGSVDQTVTVVMNECHVETQDLQLMLDPVDCTAEEVPSVVVYVRDQDGAFIPEAGVGYVPADQDWTDYQPCDAWGEGWVCGWDLGGAIDLEVTAEGYSPWSGQVTVEEDCCGPITEQVDVELLFAG